MYCWYEALANKDDERPERNHRNAGQVKHDDRGNAVWQWAADTARTAMASTSQLLRKLDVTSLSLESDEEDIEVPRAPKAQAQDAGTAARPRGDVDSVGAGFDPYSTNAGTARRAKPAITQPKAKAKATPAAVRPPVATSPPRRSWWQRLLRRD